jgi:ssDNA-binding replication factor A large subunit
LFDWKIKARITKKHPMRSWKNAKSSGNILNIELMDTQGTQIQGTFFGREADDNYDKLEEGKCYLFSNGTVKLANQKYSSIKNDHCINFDKNSIIEPTEEDQSI